MDPFSPLVGKERKDKQPKGWRNLKELVLTGNPITASGGQPDTYAKCVVVSRSTSSAPCRASADPALPSTPAERWLAASPRSASSTRTRSTRP